MDGIQIIQLEQQFVDGAYEVEKHSLNECWSREAISELVGRKDVIYLIVIENDRVCGIAGMYIVLDEGQITNVAVLPEYRKKGIGKHIFGTLIEEGKRRGVKLFTLEVASCNTAAIKLYGGFGFIEVGRRKDFYKYDSAILMNLI